MVDQQTEIEPARRVHPHPIRWNTEQQLWVCTQGCGFTRPKREGEVVPSREEAHREAQRAGTGTDFADIASGPTRVGEETRAPAQAAPTEPESRERE